MKGDTTLPALAAVVLLASAVVGAGASPVARGSAEARGSLAGQLLVATTEITDPRFIHTVVYMVRHDAGGAGGVVVNRPIAEVPLARLLDEIGIDAAGASGRVRVHYGGPVEPARAAVLHTADYAGAGTIRVTDSMALTGEPGVLRDIAAGRGPRRSLIVLGYAGWAPGQLEAEIDAGHWFSVPADEALVFDDDHRAKWERALARRPIKL